MSVGDRNALFDVLREAADPSSIWPSRGACLPLEGRLRAIMRHMAGVWSGSDDRPHWKIDQEQNLGTWEVNMVFDFDLEPKWMSRISFS